LPQVSSAGGAFSQNLLKECWCSILEVCSSTCFGRFLTAIDVRLGFQAKASPAQQPAQKAGFMGKACVGEPDKGPEPDKEPDKGPA
jgi:hypothetical protein